MCIMEVKSDLVISCAWCPKRVGDLDMMVRCEKWAQARNMKVSHGCCEVCKKQYFSELKP